LIQFSDVINPY